MLLQPQNRYLESLREPRNLVDIALVFLLVYSTAARYDLATLEFILRPAPLYVGVAIIVLFQNEIRQALISFGNRFRVPFLLRHRGQFGEGVYDEIVLAATTLASTKTGALIVVERGVNLRNVIEGGVKMHAELLYDLLVTISNSELPLHDGLVVIRGH